MCGISVIIDKQNTGSGAAIKKITGANTHRGPDAIAYYQTNYGKGKIYFGHNRLKIIDCSDQANQPFFSEDQRYLLLYNGEIYNYLSLRAELKVKGYSFRTTSDTEVVLALLVTHGHTGLEKLNGMFALVFYDTQTQQLLAARDRFGIKKLYYAHSEQFLIISSEINSLLASGLVKKELNEKQLMPYLLYRHALKPETFFRNIYELPEGKKLHFAGGKLHLEFYVTEPATEYTNNLSDSEITVKTESLLLESVEKHLLADVSIGLFLSGGADSTLILALIQKLGHRHFPAFTISNKASESTFGSHDYRFSRIAARQFGAEHHSFEINASILQNTDALVATLDQPIADGAALLTYYLSEQIKPTVKVALSGAGADELFGGYNRHRAFYQVYQNQRAAQILLPLVKGTSKLLPTGIAHPWRKKFLLIRKLANKIQPNNLPQTFLNFTSMDRHLQQLLLPEFYNQQAFITKSGNSSNNLLRWSLDRDLHEYLISDILAMTDKTSMAHSLEVRTPYLENQLHAFIKSLPPETLFKNGSKWILKRILDKYQEQEIANRPKEGFGMPLGYWLQQTSNQWLLQDLQDPKHIIFHYIRFPETQLLIEAMLKGRYDYSAELWALIILSRWLQKHFAG